MGIRRARLADLDAVLTIENSWKTTPHWSHRQFQAEIENPASLFLVSDGEKGVEGYGVLWVVPPEGQLLDLAVAPARARRGVARALLQAMTIMARGWGCMAVTLEVSAENKPAQALYESAGFRVVGRRAKFYNDGSDALLMDLHLL
jgi:[ribosomal protein S18]-alanine N-acetyltransferase